MMNGHVVVCGTITLFLALLATVVGTITFKSENFDAAIS
jgi:hypothetical protein